MTRERPTVCPRSERIVVDSVFSDGTVRLLRSRRRESEEGLGLDCKAWEREEEHEVSRLFLEALLAEELNGRQIQEGDVLFVHDGDSFFKKKMQDISKALASGVNEGKEHELGQRPSIKGESLILSLDEAKWIARQDIKSQFAKLIVAQGIKDQNARERLVTQVDQAVQIQTKMEKGLQESTD